MKRPVWAIIAAIIMASASVLLGAGPDAQWLGVLWTKGKVFIGNAPVVSGTTVMPGDVISTSSGASAWVRFRSPASTVLLADTQAVMLASNSAPSLLLRRGAMVIQDKVTDPVQVAVAGGFVLVKGDPQTGGECEMASLNNTSTVTVKSGVAEVHGKGAPLILRAGQSARLEAGQQGGSQQPAGKINKQIPQGVIEREGLTHDLPMTLNQVIDWNDLLRTMEKGRAQVTLIDGSTLNIGARSELRIVKHDPENQQTQLELALGKVQANVERITAPGGKFELRTRSAVIGTIDTAFVAQTEGNETRVCGVDGITTVRSSDPNRSKVVKLRKNECTVVILGQDPTDPVLDPAEVASLLDATNIEGAGATAVAGRAAGSTFPWAWVLLGSDAAAGAIVAGVVLSSGATTSPVTPPPP